MGVCVEMRMIAPLTSWSIHSAADATRRNTESCRHTKSPRKNCGGRESRARGAGQEGAYAVEPHEVLRRADALEHERAVCLEDREPPRCRA